MPLSVISFFAAWSVDECFYPTNTPSMRRWRTGARFYPNRYVNRCSVDVKV